MCIGIRMRSDTHTLRMDDRWALLRLDILHRFLHGSMRVKKICSVTANDMQMLQPNEIIGHACVCALFMYRHGYAVAIILNNKDNGKFFSARAVKCFVAIAF